MLYQIRLNSYGLVKSGGVKGQESGPRSQESGVVRRENHKDERSYDDSRFFYVQSNEFEIIPFLKNFSIFS